jgi:hypothetical protein
MTHLSLTSAQGAEEAVSLVSPFLTGQNADAAKMETIDILRTGRVQRDSMQNLLSTDPRQSSLDMQALLDMIFRTAPESMAFGLILEHTVAERWALSQQLRKGAHLMQCSFGRVRLSAFDGCEVVPYEFMPTKVLPSCPPDVSDASPYSMDSGATLGTAAKLFITFPQGAEEAEKPHCHPGGRIILSTGPGRFNSPYVENGVTALEEGTVVLMPRMLLHNFAAYPTSDWRALSLHLPYAGTHEGTAIIFDK